MRLYDQVAGLSLEIDSVTLEGLVLSVSTGFERHTTVVRLEGAGEHGVGEDVAYDAEDQRSFRQSLDLTSLAGRYSLDEFSRQLDRIDLFPKIPSDPAYRDYRRWAFESAALDLALRQAGTSLSEHLGIRPNPVRFVVSMNLGKPPSFDRVRNWLSLYPALQFKLDATSAWTPELVDRLAQSESVESIDLKGAYHGTIVDQPADAALYRMVAEGLPRAWIEDPALTPETREILAEHRQRITWDAPIHSVEDIRRLEFRPSTLNIKPSRFGTLFDLFEAYEYCREQRISMYGGGQFELGPGRGQIQYLASLFHPEGPNDVAPRRYNVQVPSAGLPTSPLVPGIEPRGFRWRQVQ